MTTGYLLRPFLPKLSGRTDTIKDIGKLGRNRALSISNYPAAPNPLILVQTKPMVTVTVCMDQ